MPTPDPNAPPHVGGPLAAFVQAYGQPNGGGPVERGQTSDTFFDAPGAFAVTATADSAGTVIMVDVFVLNKEQLMEACVAYLPGDTTAFDTTAAFGYYHSGIGEVVIEYTGQSHCIVFFADS
jgi:hypothetical protein